MAARSTDRLSLSEMGISRKNGAGVCMKEAYLMLQNLRRIMSKIIQQWNKAQPCKVCARAVLVLCSCMRLA